MSPEKVRRIAIRTDASHEIGSGHLMRCLTLAEALKARGASVEFVCREHAGNLIPVVERRGFTVARLAKHDSFRPDPSMTYSAWVGASSEDDARETIAALREEGKERPEWLVVDHYGIGAEWEGALRPEVGRLMVIDDLADRSHECDLLLDQNLVASMGMRYDRKVSEATAMLLGPDYALLQPQYGEMHRKARVRSGVPKRALVSFGGADRENFSGASISALTAGGAELEVDVVVSEGGEHAVAVRRQADGHPNVRVHTALPSLAPLMASADIAIGAAGATSWERLCLGLPSIVVTLAENQRPIAEELDRRKLIRWLGSKDTVTSADIADAVSEIVREGIDPSWSERCLAVVDGKGTERICEVLLAGRGAELRAREAEAADEALLLRWANDRITRKNAFSSKAIEADVHHQWLAARLGRPDVCRIYIVETPGGYPVGQTRFQREGESWEVHYGLAPEMRGRGLGSSFLETALTAFRGRAGKAKVFGRVKSANAPSMRIFETLGFSAEADAAAETITYRRDL